jgi:hypothetical protein
MDQNETLSAGEDGLPVDDSGISSTSKRLKFASAKVAEQNTAEKLPQMVINNDLLTFIAKFIQADPVKWGVLLTTKHGKTGVANKFVKFLSEHPNPLTHGKTAAPTTVSRWIKGEKTKLKRRQSAELQEMRQCHAAI